jgi:HlyD family secretion protein
MVIATRKKNTIWIAAAVAALAGGAYYFATRDSTDKTKPKYELATAEKGPVIAKVTASGTLSALVTVQVGSQVSGRIKELFVDFNSTVKKDQVIAKIDPQLFDAALASARANHLAARANLSRSEVGVVEATRQFDRAKTLGERNLIAKAEVDTAEANRDSAKAQVDASRAALAQTEAALKQAQVNLAYTTIVSPINGVVISRSVDVGQTVAASLQAPTLFIIAEDLRKMQVNTSVAEADVGKLVDGMAATFVVDAHPNDRFEGTVRQIRNSATTTQNIVTYDAVIDVENPDLKLRPGMTANVTFIHARSDDALRVPNAALRYRPAVDPKKRGPKQELAAGMRTVWIVGETGVPQAVAIRTGITDGTNTVVESGLEEGAQVITGGTGGGTGEGGGAGQRPAGGSGRNPFRGL